jgi:hypothetical protein
MSEKFMLNNARGVALTRLLPPVRTTARALTQQPDIDLSLGSPQQTRCPYIWVPAQWSCLHI